MARTAAEEIAAIMAGVLRVPAVAVTDDFFALGGDSLRATQVVGRIVERYAGPDSPAAGELRAALLLSIFDDPRPAGLAPVLAGLIGRVPS